MPSFLPLSTAPPAAREISSRLKKFSSSASSSALHGNDLLHAMVRPPYPLLLDGNMRHANIVSGRAGLKEEISERPRRKREKPDLDDRLTGGGEHAV